MAAARDRRLNLRLGADQDEVIRLAAEVRGESVTDYVVRHAVEAAESDLADRRLFIVNDAAWTQLNSMLSSPPVLPGAIAKLLANPSVLEEP